MRFMQPKFWLFPAACVGLMALHPTLAITAGEPLFTNDLLRAPLVVAVKDKQGNLTRIERSFSVGR